MFVRPLRPGQTVVYVMGGANTGKNTMVRTVCEELGVPFYDTGRWYRALTWAAMQPYTGAEFGSPHFEQQVCAIWSRMELRVEGDRTWINGRERTGALELQAVSAHIAPIAGLAPVRELIAAHQYEAFGHTPELVLIGRTPGEPFARVSLVVEVVKDAAEAAVHGLDRGVTTSHELTYRDAADAANYHALGLTHAGAVPLLATGLSRTRQAERFRELASTVLGERD